MEKIFVQWMLGQFNIAKVTYQGKHYAEFEVLYPFQGIKGDYFSETEDLTDEENNWIIKNFIHRVTAVYLEISLRQRIWQTDLQDEKWFTNGDVKTQVIEKIHNEKGVWWEDDYIKFFSIKTIDNIVNRINECLADPARNFVEQNHIMDREQSIEKFKNVIFEEKINEVYIYLCDRRFDFELKHYHKKIELEENDNADYEIALALTESSYSYPDLCLTTHSDLLRKEFERKSTQEKMNLYKLTESVYRWHPYMDLAKEWYQEDDVFCEFKGLKESEKSRLYDAMRKGESTKFDDLLMIWWHDRIGKIK